MICRQCGIDKEEINFYPKRRKCKYCLSQYQKQRLHEQGKLKTYRGEIRINLTGKRFGKLRVTNISELRNPKSTRYWLCKCDCGNECYIKTTNLTTNKTKSCGCLKFELTFDRNPNWLGCGELSGGYFSGVKWGATRRNLSVEITIEDAWNKFKEQDGKCALSGREIVFNGCYRGSKITASLDRIDSSKGYTKDNIQWVHKHVNKMKQEFDEQYFIELCKDIARNSS